MYTTSSDPSSYSNFVLSINIDNIYIYNWSTIGVV
jgi:hypothetical protein